nr:hypothetical protein [Myxococcota bacterium]
REAWHAARLREDRRPSTPAAALAVLGIVCWLAGIAVIVRRGIDAPGNVVRRPALIGAALIAGGLVAWAAGLYNA